MNASREDALLERTLPGRLVLYARSRPDVPALREKRLGLWKEISWRQYFENVAATARQMYALGIRTADHIAILSDNRPEWLYADLAAQGLGARSVGVYQTNPPEDVAYIVTHSASKILFCEDQEQVDKAIEIRDETPECQHIVVFDPRGTRHYDDPRLMTWDDFLARGRELLKAEDNGFDWFTKATEAVDPEQPSMVVYTSGTTGPPKGAMISNKNVIGPALRLNPVLGASDKDTVLSYLPLCHVAEKIFSLFLPLTCGATVHFGESIATVRQDIAEVSPTVFLGVPRIWEKMHASVTLKMRDSSFLKRRLFNFFIARGQAIARRKNANGNRFANILDRLIWFVGDMLVFRALQERLGLRNCRLGVSGAAPISPDLLRWFAGIGVPVYEGYGMTECGGVSHTNMIEDNRIGTVGRPAPGIEQQLAEDNEILIRGENVFCGYLHNEEATRSTIDEEGWLHTGDVGSIDEDGFLRITGRKKEIIITAGGKNLSPEKIENALKMSPYVKEAVALGDAQKFIGALIQIDYDAVGDWAQRKEIPYTSFEDLALNPETRKLIDKEVAKANELLARVENVRKFELFRKELHQDDGEMTATQKVRRRAVKEIHADLIEAIYGSSAS